MTSACPTTAPGNGPPTTTASAWWRGCAPRRARGCWASTRERLAATYAATTLPELAPITADLPETTRPGAGKPPAPGGRSSVFDHPLLQDDAFRWHLTMYLLIIGMLVGIWLLSGAGHFWPFYPAAGWGIAVGMHAEATRSAQRKRVRSAAQVEARSPSPTPAVGAGPRDAGPTNRRYVVALFVDVVNSTSLNEALGDERWLSVRRAYRALVATCISNSGGWEANSSGDGVLARFDHPEDAAGAAVELLRRLEQRRIETGFAPSVRVGIHSGDAMDEDGDIIGTVVNLAARVTDAADVDEILVTEHVADHLDSSFPTTGRGLHTLKGVGRPRHLMAVEWR